jgi:hypothetical protein
MLATVYFDSQSGCWTIKIQNKMANRMLSAKAETSKAFTSQATPQEDFCISHILAQVTGCL